MAVSGRKYCSEHLIERKPFEKATRHSEGMYNTYRWKKLRAESIKNHPYCSECGSTENLTCDHIQDANGDPELFYMPENIEVLCSECHNRKSAEHANEIKREKQFYKETYGTGE